MRRVCTFADRSPSSAPTASRRRCVQSTSSTSRSCSSAPSWTTSKHPSSAATGRLVSSTTSMSRTSGAIEMYGGGGNGEADEPVAGGWHPGLRESATFDRKAIAEIQRAAREGIYDIRGFGAKRRVPNFDDLLLLGASVSRYPLEGYRERCATDVVIGGRFAREPVHLDIPITIAGMKIGRAHV